MDKYSWVQRAFYFSMFGCIQFILLTFLAMFTYSGGTQIDPHNPGYSFFQNFFSDLGTTESYSGNDNLISFLLFFTSISISGISFLFFFLAIPTIFEDINLDKRIPLITTVLGIFSSFMFIGIALTPDNLFSEIHDFFVTSAFTLALFASIFMVFLTYTDKNYSLIFPVGYIIFICLVLAYGTIGLLFFDNYTNIGLFIRVTTQKVVIYSLMVNFFLQIYGNLNIIKSKAAHK